ncbi:maltase 1 [Orussus abietinus]|uniref:maltase 1 n=1 Tax=Orussus abietinus TaxID=222816 RepID=UPI0006255A2C|nr:maltase 1 [Orussus abietinus]
MSLHAVTLCLFLGLVAYSAAADKNWRKNALVYQVYPRSFKDSNGDGVGDLNGITSKLEHIKDIGATAFWISPINTSPMVDFGYDISNFTDIDPVFGTLADFQKLTARAKALGLKVLLDFVPNHSSHEHEWFKKSVKRIKPYDEYYIWRDAKVVNGVRHPPNNWLSVFWGSAWEWNQERGQYYFHQFAVGQPDLNYRSKALDQEMKNVLKFWLDRGVEGFRIDAINHMFEDPRFLDEPRSFLPGVKPNEYEYLDHIYTRNLNETYDVLKSWRNLLDQHSKLHGTDPKIILTEAYTFMPLTMKYYTYGSNAPMNFMFIADLNNGSTASDFKRTIDNWMNNIPDGEYVANWVVGNHDNHRAASRFGTLRADQLNMLSLILPGIGIVYNGDEIGMEDNVISWKDTVDPAGCNAGPDKYHLKSRDPERTPFQWDNTKNAGFTTGNKTWLPVHPNYKTLNLAAQKKVPISHYNVFKSLVRLRQLPVLRDGALENILVHDNVLGIVRRLRGSPPVALLVNFSNSPIVVDVSTRLNLPRVLTVYTASIYSKIPVGSRVDASKLTIPGSASIVLSTPSLGKYLQAL